MTGFNDLGLIAPITAAVRAEGYTEPTPIQQRAIPHVLAGRDLLGLAQTGTGKTAAFALPILQRLHAGGVRPHGGRPVRVLVLSPTRELAAQIGDSFAAYGRNLGYRHAVIFGGVGHEPQRRALRAGVDILVATPGRLLDLAGEKVVDLSRLEIFVLDEADRMLDMGFIHDVKRVIAMLPRQRQTLFFSATMPPEAQRLADVLLHQPETVAVTPPSSTVERIDQMVYFVEKARKRELLGDLLNGQRDMKRVLVFTRTKHGANRVAEYLDKEGVRAEAIHGNKSQNARERALEHFKTGHTPVLVATDIAARGIDVDDVSHVIQFDLPEVPETYVHRIGRTARAGASGIAIAFCDEEETGLLSDIEKLIKRQVPLGGGEIPRWAAKGAPLAYPPPPKRGSQPRPARAGGPPRAGHKPGGPGHKHGGDTASGKPTGAPRPPADHGHGRADKAPGSSAGRRRRRR